MSGFRYDESWQASIVVSIVSFILLDVAFIGASLSEPYTSVTALAEVVCMYVCGHIP